MLFCSFEYIFLFLPLVLIGYRLVLGRMGSRKAKAVLLVGSLIFYGYWKATYLLVIGASILVNYWLSRIVTGNTGFPGLNRKRAFYLSLLFNLGLLCTFKYLDFLIENVCFVAAIPDPPVLGILLPLGISFFTFQQIAYQVDCYKEEGGGYRFLDYALFVSFFPQLIAGPIVHHKEMMPQFEAIEPAYDWKGFAAGVNIFIIGLCKKILIADTVAVWANSGFNAAAPLGFFDAWTASLSYTFQLYFDFSGYCDMAIGSALLFGIHLPVNFLSPYKALSIQDFWRRWHITLSRWLRDYIYIPLGGNRVKESRIYLNILITFFLGGLWHGAGWTFVLWGVMHGVALSVQRLWSKGRVRLHFLLAWGLTFLFVNFAWVMFRAESLASAVSVYRGMLGMNGFSGHTVARVSEYVTGVYQDFLSQLIPGVLPLDYTPKGAYLAFFALLAFLAPNSIQITDPLVRGGEVGVRSILARSSALTLLFGASLCFMAIFTSSDFLYFNF